MQVARRGCRLGCLLAGVRTGVRTFDSHVVQVSAPGYSLLEAQLQLRRCGFCRAIAHLKVGKKKKLFAEIVEKISS